MVLKWKHPSRFSILGQAKQYREQKRGLARMRRTWFAAKVTGSAAP